MKKLLTLFTLLLCVCSGAWADPTATLINQSTGAVDNTNFRCTSTTSTKSGGYSIGTGSYEKYIQLGGAFTTPIGAYEQNKIIQYDAKTNSVTVDVYAYNKASSDYKLYISMIEEGDTEEKDIDIQEFTLTKNSGDKKSYTFTPSTNATIYVHVGNNSNVHICQVEVTDNGATTLKQGGEIGYTANLTLCRLGLDKKTASMDGMEFKTTNNNVKVLTSGNPVKLKSTSEYIKFILAETERVTINASGTYSVTTNDSYQSASAKSGNQTLTLDAGTYYVCPNGSNVTFASISFLAPPTLYAVEYDLGEATGGTAPTESSKAEGATFSVASAPGDLVAPSGKEFKCWNDGNTDYNPGDTYTVGTSNVTLTAVYQNITVKYDINYDLGDATGGTAPTQVSLAEGATFEVAAAPGDLVAPSGKEFSTWNDGTNDYAPGDTYTMGTSNVTLTAQYVNIKCATPTITVGAFNFANKGYKVTITNNEDGSTLYYSTNNVDWTEYTSALYATTTTHYYAKSVKASYDDSEVADENVTNTFDGGKKYIAWVRQNETYTDSEVTYSFADDGMVSALSENYNVVDMPIASNTSITSSHDIKNADLIVLSEAVGGGTNLAKGMKNFIGVTPMINLKVWASTTASGRWGWATATNVDGSGIITPSSTRYKFLSGVTFTGSNINMFDGTTGRIQVLTWSSEPTNNVDLGTNNEKVAMHAIINDENLDKQFFAMGVCCNYRTQYSVNTKTIIKNVAAILIAGTERLDAEVATVPVTISAAKYASFCSSYALDFSETDVKAYKAKVEENEVKLTKVDEVPAGEGVILYCETADTYNIPVIASAAAVTDNEMVGVTTETTVVWNPSTGVYNYILQQGVFNKASESGAKLRANRAYLNTSYNVNAPGAKPLTIVFNDEEQGEETDGIKSVQGSGFTVNGEAYNLSGQRVGADYKGLVIINGKKVIRK